MVGLTNRTLSAGRSPVALFMFCFVGSAGDFGGLVLVPVWLVFEIPLQLLTKVRVHTHCAVGYSEGRPFGLSGFMHVFCDFTSDRSSRALWEGFWLVPGFSLADKNLPVRGVVDPSTSE